jgi:hypothetical protein
MGTEAVPGVGEDPKESSPAADGDLHGERGVSLTLDSPLGAY